MGYMIYEDLENATPIKIHVDYCMYVDKSSSAKTSKWHGPYDYAEGEKVAEGLSEKYNKGWRAAQCCLARHRITDKEGHMFWVPGLPATFATKKEAPWKETLKSSIPAPTDDTVNGITMNFMLPTLAPRNQPLDVDNLCEPVFSALVNKIGWFGKKRSNIKRWRASKSSGSPSGMELYLEENVTDAPFDKIGFLAFANVFKGELPSSATDSQIPKWLEPIENKPSFAEDEKMAIRLQFGDPEVNIGNITTGKVKSTIDCLYPLIGGKKGSPEDWRIDFLEVEKDVRDLDEDSVRIELWKI